MKKLVYILLAGGLISCSGQSTTETESSFLNESLKAHGGLETYQNLKTLSYLKKTILYDSYGVVESETVQTHSYSFQPSKGEITWESEGKSHKVTWEGQNATKWVDGVEDVEGKSSAESLMNSSQFVLFQPFKLKDGGTKISEVDNLHLFNPDVYTTLQPTYQGESTDKWWFYVDPYDFLIVANLVLHNGRYSFIHNLEFDTTTPLVLHKHRKSYFTDETISDKLLRAEYFYTEYKAEFGQ